MKQKRLRDKRKNAINMGNKRTAYSTAYEIMKPGATDHQKGNYDDQTDNKKNNRNTDMSMGFENKKKLKTKPMDQKEEKPSSPKEAVTTTSSQLAPPESKVFDSSGNNAMSEMKKVADMGPDEASKVFSHLEEKQQLDPSTASINDSIKKTDPGHTTFPAMIEPTSQEREKYDSVESIEDGNIVPRHDGVESDIAQIHNESEKQDRLDESVIVYDNENRVFYSNYPNYDNYDPFIIGIRYWQANTVGWIGAYNGFLKAWVDNTKLTRLPFENSS
jgi:hypothetical protein